MFRKIIYKLGEKLRNPSLKNEFIFLKESEKWSLKKLEEYQLLKIKELLNIAYINSVFYKNKFDELGIDITKISSFDDFKKIPLLTKKELLNNSLDIQTDLKFKKTFLATTSGNFICCGNISLHFIFKAARESSPFSYI